MQKVFPVAISSRLFPISFSKRFRVSDFILRLLIHLELSFVYGDKYRSICSLLHYDNHLALPVLFVDVYYSVGISGFFFVNNQFSIVMCIHISIFNFISLLGVFILLFYFLKVHCCFHYTSSVVQLKIWDGDTPSSSLISQDCLAALGFCVFI